MCPEILIKGPKTTLDRIFSVWLYLVLLLPYPAQH